MLENSPCDVDSDVDDDDAGHADVVDIDSQTDSQVDTPETENDNCEVCLTAPRNPRIALVPCGHQRFCSTSADRVRDEGRGCSVCRTEISFVLNLYWSDWTVQLFELFWLDWTVSLMELNCFFAYGLSAYSSLINYVAGLYIIFLRTRVVSCRNFSHITDVSFRTYTFGCSLQLYSHYFHVSHFHDLHFRRSRIFMSRIFSRPIRWSAVSLCQRFKRIDPLCMVDKTREAVPFCEWRTNPSAVTPLEQTTGRQPL